MRFFAVFLSLCLMLMAAPAAAQVKLALVIDQVAYRGNLSPLAGADTEAGEVAASLTAVGFTVTRASNLTKQGLATTFREFRRKVSATPGAVAFIYYTGHGSRDPASDANDNYLLGVDSELTTASDLPEFGVPLSDLNEQFSATGAKAVIMVIDACRTTPTFGKAGSKGLVPVTASTNTLIAYATDTGDVADVGVYAPILAQEIRRSGQDVTQVFSRVQILVSKKTQNKQRPWSNNRLYDQICLASCDVVAGPTPLPLPPAGPSDWDKEKAVWDGAKSCADYKAYLISYPQGAFAATARERQKTTECAGPGGVSTVMTATLNDVAGVPDWIDFYPSKALRKDVAGRSVVECVVQPDGRLSQCLTVSETPVEMGFAEAAHKALTSKARVDTGKFPPGQRVRFPIKWQVPKF
ncbi:caspase family protein [Asticcacaulis sp. YBE204]|uniref:caspase family protein n=1 Tax=Asticcacaulis sp. YBE204 TaxID=1282363 RepID=UPI0004CEC8D8|nr:caspase family protein [Asticcacaulis sp. YBE204]